MSSTLDQPTTPGAPPPAEKKRDRTHFLYMAVIVAMIAGIAVGFLFPEFGKELKPLGTFFVNLIKMMIGPIIFVTIVLGIGSVKRAAQVGKVGGLALGYFVTMSTVALAVGLVVGNLVKPGAGLNLTDELAKSGQDAVSAEAESTTDFILGLVPDTLVSALTRARCSRRCSWRSSSASRCRRWAPRASRSCAASSTSRSSSSASWR